MSIVLNNPMQNYMFNIEHDHETEYASSWRSVALSLSNSDDLGAQPLLDHSNDHSTCVVGDRQMVDERHLIFHCYDGYFLMNTSLLNENIFPSVYLDPYGFNMVIDEWSSYGNLQEVALQHPMKCGDIDLIWEDGILHWRNTHVEHNSRHSPLVGWVIDRKSVV